MVARLCSLGRGASTHHLWEELSTPANAPERRKLKTLPYTTRSGRYHLAVQRDAPMALIITAAMLCWHSCTISAEQQFKRGHARARLHARGRVQDQHLAEINKLMNKYKQTTKYVCVYIYIYIYRYIAL